MNLPNIETKKQISDKLEYFTNLENNYKKSLYKYSNQNLILIDIENGIFIDEKLFNRVKTFNIIYDILKNCDCSKIRLTDLNEKI